jgi:GT2 family glycosyltransferase
MNNPLLSIIIVSFNTADITINCLKSIIVDKGLKKIPYEIIIVDNDSHDNSLKVIANIAKQFPKDQIKIIANKHNAGFGTANNQGVAIAQGNYVLLLNSDTLILHSAISQSLNWLSAHPEACACTAQLLNKDKSIQASGGYFPNLLNVLAWSSGLDDLPFTNKVIKPFHPHTPNFYTKDNFFQKDHQQDWVTGAFFLTRKNLYDEIKGFDENYFMYGEEVDLCYRLKKNSQNNQIWYLIGPQIIHLGGASAVSRFNPIFNEYQGVVSFFKKHQPSYQVFLVKYILKINAFLRSLFYYLVNKKETASFYKQACQKI